MELLGEGVGNGLLLARGDLDRVLLGGQVAHNLVLASSLLGEGAANQADANCLGLVVADGQASFGGMAVDELDAKDLSLGERDRDLDVQVRRLGLLDGLLDTLSLRRGLAN